MVLDQKIADLENSGYTCRAFNIPAVAVGAHHERQRIFLVANASTRGWTQLLCPNPLTSFAQSTPSITLGAQGNPFLQFEESLCEPALFALPDGIPDHIFRLGAVGDSIASPIPLILLTCIQAIYKENNL